MTKIVETSQRTTITHSQTPSSTARVLKSSNATDSIGSAQTNQGHANNIQELTFVQTWGRFLQNFLTNAPRNLGRFLYSFGTNTPLPQETRTTATTHVKTIESSSKDATPSAVKVDSNAVKDETQTSPSSSTNQTLAATSITFDVTQETANTELFISPQGRSEEHKSSLVEIHRLLTTEPAARPPITPTVLKFDDVLPPTASSNVVAPSAPQASNPLPVNTFLLNSIREEFFVKNARPDSESAATKEELLIQEIILQMVRIKAQTTSLTEEDLTNNAIHTFKKASLKSEQAKHVPHCVKTALADTTVTTQDQALHVLELLKHKSVAFANWLSAPKAQDSASKTLN